jgi:hypothetical protein
MMALFEDVSVECNIPLPVLDVKQMRALQFFMSINIDYHLLRFLDWYYR